LAPEEPRRILIIADIHANYQALSAVLDRFGSAGEIWCLGDIVEWGPRPADCVDLIRECGARTVQGNHDSGFLSPESIEKGWAAWDRAVRPDHLKFLRELPTSLTINLNGSTFFLAHGSPCDPLSVGLVHTDTAGVVREKIAGCDADVIVGGHTHVPMFLELDGKLIVNAGAAGQPEDGVGQAQCMLYENGRFRYERVAYDHDALADDYARSGLPEGWPREPLEWQTAGIVSVRGLRENPLAGDQTRIIRLD